MPIVQRAPEPSPPVAARRDLGALALHGSPGVLLHPGDPWAPSTAGDDPPAELAAAARLLALCVDRPGRRPARWPAPAFAREVEAVRSHLRPINTPCALAASFAREAFRGPLTAGSHLPFLAHPAGVAYAIRWLELDEGRTVPGWAAWLGPEPKLGSLAQRTMSRA